MMPKYKGFHSDYSNDSPPSNPNDSRNIPDRSKSDYHCPMCQSRMNSRDMWNAHIIGKRHLKNLKKPPGEMPSKVKSVPCPIRPRIADELEDTDEIIVGLSFICETNRQDKMIDPFYSCHLCQGTFTVHNIMEHIISSKHRINYLKKEDPDHEILDNLRLSKPQLEALLLERASIMEERYGRGTMEVKIERMNRPGFQPYTLKPHHSSSHLGFNRPKVESRYLHIDPSLPSTSSAAVGPPSTAVRPPSTAVRPPSTAVRPPSTAVRPPSTAVRPPSTAVRPPSTAVRPPSTAVRPPSTAVRPPSTAVRPPSTAVRPPSTAVRPPSTAVRPPSTAVRPPSTAVRPPSTAVRPPSTAVRPPSTAVRPPSTAVQPSSAASMAVQPSSAASMASSSKSSSYKAASSQKPKRKRTAAELDWNLERDAKHLNNAQINVIIEAAVANVEANIESYKEPEKLEELLELRRIIRGLHYREMYHSFSPAEKEEFPQRISVEAMVSRMKKEIERFDKW